MRSSRQRNGREKEMSEFKPIQIYKKLHSEMKLLAVSNEILLKILVSEIVARMFESHKEEIKEIIKEIKIKSSK